MAKIPPRGFFAKGGKKNTKRAALQEKLSKLTFYKKEGDELTFKNEKDVKRKASELHSVAKSLGITIATRAAGPDVLHVYLVSNKRRKRRKRRD